MGGLDTRPALFHRHIGDGELVQVVANHLGLDFHLVEDIAIKDTHHAAHHLWQDGSCPTSMA